LLVEHLNKQLRPDLVLITGDIVDSPKPEFFRTARQQIGRSMRRIASVPATTTASGEATAHRQASSAGSRARFEGRRTPPGRSAASSKPLQGRPGPRPGIAYDIDLPAGGVSPNNWRLRVLGCDSCEEDTFFAQGVLNATTISALHNHAIAGKDRDLVIVLVHHHLLPIAALEQSVQPNLKALANVTGMLNAGTALNMLAKSYVNLVLHGHEHYPQSARFRTGSLAHGEVAVIAAGSATGTVTLQGWSMKNARFNLLELTADRSVTLKEIRGEGQFFTESDQPAIKLLDAEDIRRARFLRRTHPQRTPPRSRLTRMFEFGLDRDGVITDTRTDWLVWRDVGDADAEPHRHAHDRGTRPALPERTAGTQVLRFREDPAGDNSFEAVFDLRAEGGASAIAC
jgi:hypothetical protein